MAGRLWEAFRARQDRQLKPTPNPDQVTYHMHSSSDWGGRFNLPACLIIGCSALLPLYCAVCCCCCHSLCCCCLVLPSEVLQSHCLPSIHLCSPSGSCYFIACNIYQVDQLFIINIYILYLQGMNKLRQKLDANLTPSNIKCMLHKYIAFRSKV